MKNDDSEDEILLSPRKKVTRLKRPSSPLDISIVLPLQKRSRCTPLIEHEHITRPETTPETVSRSRQRAQSVPANALSPQKQANIPHIDLSTPSFSPTKRLQKFRFTSVPPDDMCKDGPGIIPSVTPSHRKLKELLGIPMSPLTPLPPTPQPVKLDVGELLGRLQPMENMIMDDPPLKPKTPPPLLPVPASSVHTSLLLSDSTLTEVPIIKTPKPSRLPRLSTVFMLPPSALPNRAEASGVGRDKPQNVGIDYATNKPVTPILKPVKARMKPRLPAAGVAKRVTRSASLREQAKSKKAIETDTEKDRSGTARTAYSPRPSVAPTPAPRSPRKSSIPASFPFSFAAPTSSSTLKTREPHSRPSSPAKVLGTSSRATSQASSRPLSRTESWTTTKYTSRTQADATATSSVVPTAPLSKPKVPVSSSTLSEKASGQGTSLSTLSLALEKLSMPVPQRPNTSLGFNDGPGAGSSDSETSTTKGLSRLALDKRSHALMLKTATATTSETSMFKRSRDDSGIGAGTTNGLKRKGSTSSSLPPRKSQREVQGTLPAMFRVMAAAKGKGKSKEVDEVKEIQEEVGSGARAISTNKKVEAEGKGTAQQNEVQADDLDRDTTMMPPPPLPKLKATPQSGVRTLPINESSATAADVPSRASCSGSSSGLRRPRTLLGRAPVPIPMASDGTGALSRPSSSTSTHASVGMGSRGRGFGVGIGRMMVRDKASRKTSLPSVAASPVKGGGVDCEEKDDIAEGNQATHKPNAGTTTDPDTDTDADTDGLVIDRPVAIPSVTLAATAEIPNGKDADKQKPLWRRASLASHALSQSLSALPPSPAPSTPKRTLRSTSSAYPSGVSPASPSKSGSRQDKPKGGEKGMGKVLKECTIFVDVRTDDGDDAGALFVDMLKGMGAKILGRVGQTCTHIVFKNGLMSTLTRYRLLHEPLPLVVGIAWVVECVEHRARVDESRFSVDLEGLNIAGTNKRRRSMLPKHLIPTDFASPSTDSSQGDGDRSLERSFSSSTIIDSDALDMHLPPLERARRRRAARA